jgi:hypothetical protein
MLRNANSLFEAMVASLLIKKPLSPLIEAEIHCNWVSVSRPLTCSTSLASFSFAASFLIKRIARNVDEHVSLANIPVF